MTIDYWVELNTLQDVAKAQADGWKIEFQTHYGDWRPWDGEFWLDRNPYRGRPKQPKTYTMNLTAWFDGTELRWSLAGNLEWKRVPTEDKVIKVEE